MATRKITSENYPAVRKEIAAGDYLPVYFICGDETFFVDSFQSDLLKILPQDLRDFNMDVFYGTEAKVPVVLSAARSFPMMSEKRVVVLRDFSAIFDSRNKQDSDSSEGNTSHDQELLIQYLNNPSPSTLFIITDKKSPGNSKIGNIVTKSDLIGFAKFDPLSDNVLPEWIIKWCNHRYQVQIEPQAAQLLVERIGSDLLQITAEIEKMSISKGKEGSITREDVAQSVRVTREVSIFDFKDAIVSKDLNRALTMSDQMLETSTTGEFGEIFRIISYLYGYLTNIWQIQHLTQKGISSSDIQKKVGVKSDFYFRNLAKESQKFSVERIHRSFEAILDADKAAKGFSKLEPRDILFILVKRLCQN